MDDKAPKSAVQHVRDFQEQFGRSLAWFKQDHRENPATWYNARFEDGYEVETPFFGTQYLAEQWRAWREGKFVLYQRAVATNAGLVASVDAMIQEFEELASQRQGASHG